MSRSASQFRRTLSKQAIALLLACALTIGPLLALNFLSLPRATENAFERISYLTLLPVPTTPPELATTPSNVVAKQPVASPTETKAKESAYQSKAITENTPTLEIGQPAAEARVEAPNRPDLPASAPIRLDLATVRAANRASKSDVRNLAENSGAYFGDDPSSKSEQLADAITRTGKEDCIGPNPGGSILSALVIAYMAAKDKCK